MERALPNYFQTMQHLARLVIIQAHVDLVYSEAFNNDSWDYLTGEVFEGHMIIGGRFFDSQRPGKMGRAAFTDWAREVLQEYGIHQQIEQLDFDLVV